MKYVLNSRLRRYRDNFMVTIYRNSEIRKKCKIGDIIIIKIGNENLIKPIQENHCFSLPINILKNYQDGEEINLDVIGIYEKEEGKKRPSFTIINNLMDLRYFVPLKTQFDTQIYILQKDSNSSYLWYPRGGYTRPITIRNYINPIELSELIGFFYGDGSKSEGLRSFRLTNCEPFILNHCKNIMDNIAIEKSDYRCQITYSSHEIINDIIKQKCIDFWSNVLSIEKKNFVSVHQSFSKKTSLEHGSIRIQNNNTVLTELILYGVLPKLLKIILNPKTKIEHDMMYGFLRGLLAAEGFPSSHKGHLRKVEIAYNPHSNESEIYAKILSNMQIPSTRRKQGNSLTVYRYENFLKLYKIKAFSLYPSKNIKFENDFSTLEKAMRK
ncbi:MAG: hypothetical protein V1859_06670 [archaeon]